MKKRQYHQMGIMLLVFILILVFVSNLVFPADQTTAAIVKTPKLQGILAELNHYQENGLKAELQSLMDEQQLYRRDDKVRVVLQLMPGRKLSEEKLLSYGVEVERRHDTFLRVLAPIHMLKKMASELEEVSYIRTPIRAHPEGVVSEGVALTKADLYFHNPGFRGQGVKVAIIDETFANLTACINAGELPNNIIKQNYSSSNFEAGTDRHGTAVSEIVHDMAPDAQLYLIKIEDESDLEQAKDYCITNGIRVINSSLGYYNQGGYDGTGTLCDIVNDAYNHGILWVKSVGNNGKAHYMANFSDGDNNGWHNFSGATETDQCINIWSADTRIPSGSAINIYLSWGWPSSNQDYDLYLYKDNTEVKRSTNPQTGTEPPVEEINFTTTSMGNYYVKIKKVNANGNQNLNLFAPGYDLGFRTSASSFSQPGDATGCFTVGMIKASSYTINAIDAYSSRGPTLDGRIKPELVAPTQVSVWSFADKMYWTSAAAPHAAGAAALVLSECPGYTIQQLWAYLQASTIDMGPAGQDNDFGAGRLVFKESPSKWTFLTGGQLSAFSPAIGLDGIIYIGSGDKKLYAINPDGSQKWTYLMGLYTSSSPAIAEDGTIYIGSTDNKLYAVNPNGTLKWSSAIGGAVNTTPAIAQDGTIYYGSNNNKLYAVSTSGTKKWEFVCGNIISSAPVIGSDGIIYFGSSDKKLYALNTDGSQKWAYATNGAIFASPAIEAAGTIYASSIDYSLYAIRSDGTLKWTFTTGNSIQSSPAIGADGTIYVGSNDKKLYAINPNGTQKWAFTTDANINSSPAIGSDGVIYFGVYNGKLYAVNPDGSQKFYYSTSSIIDKSSPAIDGDGTVYFGTSNNKLYAISSSSIGLANSAWPKFHQNNQNTGRKQIPPSPPPTKFVGLSGYHNSVPLAWVAPTGISPANPLVSYKIERYRDDGSGHTVISTTVKRTYYRDNTAQNGLKYVYIVRALYQNGESQLAATPIVQPVENGYILTSPLITRVPTIDGTINTEEWSAAARTDITYPGLRAGVLLYVMNTNDQLYIAIDDPRDLTRSRYDAFGLFFDKNCDREWKSTYPSGEGLLLFGFTGTSITSVYTGKRGIWPNNIISEIAQNISAITPAISARSGHVQCEAKIDLQNSPLRVTPPQKIGVLIYTLDGASFALKGLWPQETNLLQQLVPDEIGWAQGPFSYGDIILTGNAPPPTATFSIYNAWWSDAVDQDGDGYTRYRRLNLDADVSAGSASVYAKIYYRLYNAVDWIPYVTTASWTITGDSRSDAVQVNTGKPNTEFAHNLYDFKIEILKTGENVVQTARDVAADTDLNDQKFEREDEDGGPVTVDVTFNVTVPNATPTADIIYIAATFNQWDPGPSAPGTDGRDHNIYMNKLSDYKWQRKITCNAGEQVEYKYTRGSWAKGEKGATGEDIANRKYTVPMTGKNYTLNDTVRSWADIPAFTAGWKAQNSGANSNLRSVDVLSSTVAWTAGGAPLVLRTIDGGLTWQDATGLLPAVTLYSMEGIDATHALVPVLNGSNAQIYLTNDGGATWNKVYDQAGGFIDDITMLTSTHGIAIGDPVGGNWTILETNNGGQTWQPKGAPMFANAGLASYSNDIFWQSGQIGWFGTTSSMAYTTLNGGTSWSPVPVPALTSIRSITFNKKGVGLMAGDGGLIRSAGGGVNWQQVSSPVGSGTLICLASTGVVFWLGGGTALYKSEDDGMSWTQESTVSTNIRNIDLREEGSWFYGYAVGLNGMIARYDKSIMTEVEPASRIVEIPIGYQLYQNYPNPFNAETHIRYELPRTGRVKLTVFDLLGHEVKVLVDETKAPGYYEASFNARDLSSGVYFYTMIVHDAEGEFYQLTKKLMLMK